MKHQQLNSIQARIAAAQADGRSALIPFCVAGHPRRESFGATLQAISRHADLIEIGLPFSDPLADGPLIAEVSRERARAGVNLEWLFQCIEALTEPLSATPILFSYLNPLLAYGLEGTLERMQSSGFGGLVVPDLPMEESDELSQLADARGLALIQLVTPLTCAARLRSIGAASRGFLYAVLRSGITGERTEVASSIDFLRRVRASTSLPVCAGFGLHDATQVHALKLEVDGLIVGSALVDQLNSGSPPGELLAQLHQATRHSIS